MTSSFKDDLKSFRRSWVHHTGMQLATLTVLGATLSVVVFVLSLSLNLKRILSSWGNTVQMTVYLQDEIDEEAARDLKKHFESMREISEATYISRDVATESFKKQMASYAPGLLADADFSSPFPSSIRLSLRGGAATKDEVGHLEALAAKIQKTAGVEDVSYGQSWIHNYSSFVSTLNASGGVMALILLCGTLFVIGNSVRASISSRREEIEILELVGATASMIRRPFVVEGLIMGLLASSIALALNIALLMWQKSAMSGSLVLARLVPLISFLDAATIMSVLLTGAMLGALGAWLTVRRINDGWSAKRGADA